MVAVPVPVPVPVECWLEHRTVAVLYLCGHQIRRASMHGQFWAYLCDLWRAADYCLRLCCSCGDVTHHKRDANLMWIEKKSNNAIGLSHGRRHPNTRRQTCNFFMRHRKRMTISKKKNPALWERCKKDACSKSGLCKHSARKMQWATRCYKSRGGKYIGKKSSDNSLHQWGQQRWRTSSGKKSNGKRRYLPDKAWRKLSKSEVRRTNAAKLRGYRQGRQYVRQPSDIARKTRKYRAKSSRASKKTKRRTRRRTKKSSTRRHTTNKAARRSGWKKRTR